MVNVGKAVSVCQRAATKADPLPRPRLTQLERLILADPTVDRTRQTLPCLYSNNSVRDAADAAAVAACIKARWEAKLIKDAALIRAATKRSIFRLSVNVKGLCDAYGIDQIGLLTLTFRDNVVCAKTAQRRFNNLFSNQLRDRYDEYVCVSQRQSRGAWHFHLVVPMPTDIRTGFNFEEVRRGKYVSACKYLKNEWKHLGKICPRYGFGRFELKPIEKSPEALAMYLADYIRTHMACR